MFNITINVQHLYCPTFVLMPNKCSTTQMFHNKYTNVPHYTYSTRQSSNITIVKHNKCQTSFPQHSQINWSACFMNPIHPDLLLSTHISNRRNDSHLKVLTHAMFIKSYASPFLQLHTPLQCTCVKWQAFLSCTCGTSNIYKGRHQLCVILSPFQLIGLYLRQHTTGRTVHSSNTIVS